MHTLKRLTDISRVSRRGDAGRDSARDFLHFGAIECAQPLDKSARPKTACLERIGGTLPGQAVAGRRLNRNEPRGARKLRLPCGEGHHQTQRQHPNIITRHDDCGPRFLDFGAK